ncbi:MAG: acyl-CoA dehydrogenase family protein [Chloroflexi bacterium]|nr:acyl-CoA dehydrogenase family protein [Chloroflexota bacterium]
MDIGPSERVRATLPRIRQLYDDFVRPREDAVAERLSNSQHYVEADGKLHSEVWEARRQIYRAAGAEGFYGLHLPEAIGGGGFTRTEMFYVEEEVYGYGLGLNPAILGWRDGPTPRLIYCNDDHRRRFADPMIRGELSSFHGVTEPQAGSDFFGLQTTARRDGDDWVLNGHKAFITNPFYADVANVLAVTDPGQGRRSFTYFQFFVKDHLDRGFRPGHVFQTVMDDGFTGELFLENLRLGSGDVLGEVGQGFEIALCSINWTRITRGGMCSGWGKWLLDRTIERVQGRNVRGRPLGTRQGVQWEIADMYADWYAARSLSLNAAAEIDAAGPWWQMPKPPELLRLFCLVKQFNDEAFYRIADRAVQLHGGVGMLKDNPVNRLFRIARNLRVPGGADEVMRSTIAETFGLREPS